MNFQTPQFIEEEAKIVGFLTLKQFLYIAAAAGLSFISFYIFNLFLWFIVSAVLAGLAASLAFVKIEGQSMSKILISGLNFLWRPRTYTWQRGIKETTFEADEKERVETIRRDIGIQGKLKAAALSVTTGKIFSGRETKKPGETYQAVTYITGEKKLAKRVDY